MRLVRLAAEHFRNLAPFELDTNGQFVVLSGDNAQGKTNTLEAVYALATLKPPSRLWPSTSRRLSGSRTGS